MTNPYPHRTVPERPTLAGVEDRWARVWDERGTYRFDRTRTRGEIYSIDTPPPTVSGSLHVGHVFSYTHTDTVARYRRMRGREVFYPMGWDDNGLPTERRVQNHFGVRCDPSLPYEPDFAPPATPPAEPVPVSRRSFVDLCHRLTLEDERAYEALWRRLGLSVDWSLTYATIDERSRAVSQRFFLRNLARGQAYPADAPTLWDVTFRTAVAQAELEDRERQGHYHRIAFHADSGEKVTVETTRPELLPACVALVTHPDDGRYAHLVGGHVTTPVFGVRVPVLAHRAAQPDKGTGIAMTCTFGDLTDVVWWRELDLPTRPVIGYDGRLLAEPPSGVDSAGARAAYGHLAGRTAHAARAAMVALLRDAGALDGEPRPTTQAVKFYEKGDRPLEIVTTRQWYIRNGGRDADLRAALLAAGRDLRWHPGYMRTRYEHWVDGLAGDWIVSRQRFFGVPIPLWYPLDADGHPDHEHPIVPDEAVLPVDPSSDTPPGYAQSQRGRPGGFTGDPDVMDTWATSSLTPQVVSGWGFDEDLFARVYPMDLRPQAHEIIRTWLFSSVLRAHQEFGALPWRDVHISGWILDPDRKKMSKSRGNTVTPMHLLEEYGSDAVRYWAAAARPGTDTAFDTGQMKVGRRLAMKILNVSRFVLGFPVPAGADPAAVTRPLDRAMLADLAGVVEAATAAFEDYDHARALAETERFFWTFCDDHVELVKARAYRDPSDPATASAHAALSLALATLLRLFAPILPFVTEEVWSWWRDGSVHRAPWPRPADLLSRRGDAHPAAAPAGAATPAGTGTAGTVAATAVDDPGLLALAGTVLSAVRRAKSEAKVSMRAEVALLTVAGTPDALAAFESVRGEVTAAGSVREVRAEPTDGPLAVTVRLA
jgi:valyl-tRNA synthetase